MMLFILLLLIPCYFIVASIHEFGHLIAGHLNGFKFYLFVVGPLGLKRNNNDKLSIYIEKKPALWGGVSATLPQNNNDKNYDAFAKVLLAGPICSIVFSAIFLPIGLATNIIFFMLIGSTSLGLGLACLIPMRSGFFYTDGGRWLRMHRKGHDGYVELAIWNVTQSCVINNNFLSINIKEIEILKKDKDPRNQYLGYYYTYNYYKDNNDSENAKKEREMIIGLKEKVPKTFVKLFSI